MFFYIYVLYYSLNAYPEISEGLLIRMNTEKEGRGH
jgi:hypothetical protein